MSAAHKTKTEIDGAQQLRIDTLRAGWSLREAYRDGVKALADLEFLGYKRANIDLAASCGAVAVNNGCIELGPKDWEEKYKGAKTPVIEVPAKEEPVVISRPLGTAPSITACSLKNADRAQKDQYWVFTGMRGAIEAAAVKLSEFGIDAFPQQNGSNGKYFMIVPIWVTGEIETSITEEESEELYVSTTTRNSIG